MKFGLTAALVGLAVGYTTAIEAACKPSVGAKDGGMLITGTNVIFSQCDGQAGSYAFQILSKETELKEAITSGNDDAIAAVAAELKTLRAATKVAGDAGVISVNQIVEKIDDAATDIEAVRGELADAVETQTEAISVLKDFVDNDVNTKLVQLKADSDQADIDLVSADAALEDKINTLQDTVGANKGAVDAAQAARNAQSVVQAAADKVVLDTLAALKKVQDAHAVFIKELSYGTVVSDPAKSCQELHKKKRPSGFYYLKGPKGVTFKGYCENDKFEGGWLMIVNGDTHEYKTHWTKANGRKAYGGTPSPGREAATKPLSKLSDDSINGYLNMPFSNTNELHAVFRFETTQCGDGNKNPMYLGSSMKKYDDNIVGMNIMQEKKVTYRYHANPGPLGKTAGMWYRNVFDTPHSSGSHKVAYFGNTHNGCQAGGRYFNGHRNTGPTANAYTCYRSRNGWGNWNQGRCFSLGSSCNCKGYGSHPQAMGIHIYVKSFADYGYKSDTP